VRSLLDRISEVIYVSPENKTKHIGAERNLYLMKRGLIGIGEPWAEKGDLMCALKDWFRPILVENRTESKLSQAGKLIIGISNGYSDLDGYAT